MDIDREIDNGAIGQGFEGVVGENSTLGPNLGAIESDRVRLGCRRVREAAGASHTP